MEEPNKNIFTVYEHQSISIYGKDDNYITPDALEALQKFYGSGSPYFSLIHKGVKFCEYVGVLQVGKYTIEILPKADDENRNWKSILIDMLKAVGVFDIHAPSSSSLNLKSNSILDLYLQLYLNEVEFLLHKGLIKRYHKAEGNRSSLKGSILFGKHIQQNLVHKERFFVRYNTYDNQHPYNAVLYNALKLISKINVNPAITNRVGALLLNFPEMPSINADAAFFERIVYNRKTDGYKRALEIAKLLLLNFHPDISKGKNDVLALMFDMNVLWEQFVYISLKKHIQDYLPGASITPQSRFDFWKPSKGYIMRLRPDIVIKMDKEKHLVMDTKWKNLSGKKPSADDLRQMYTYSKFHNNSVTALLFPGPKDATTSFFLDEGGQLECKMYSIPVENNIKDWQRIISESILIQQD